MDVRADHLAFWAAIGAVTIAWELRRGSLRMYQQSLISLVVGLPVMILVKRLTGEGVLFTLPLWAVPILVLPALPYIYADTRARRNAKLDAARPH
ncbi:hypothetical protein ABTX85_25570 [Streptomyces sp. NPDC096097]|uniref:hypothetical protein n=1 Tax=Streptomyces sp. NPDC096097 TaxID=3155546 RepID=UPI003320D33D